MNIFAKLLFFISSYFPLIVILIVNSNFSFEKSVINFGIASLSIYLTLFMLIISLAFLLWILFGRKVNPTKINIINVENKTSETLSYILPYVVAFYQVDFSNPKNIMIFIFIFITIFAVYVNSNLIAINPTLAILGYKIFIVESRKGENAYIISKRTIFSTERSIRASLILSNIYIEKENT